MYFINRIATILLGMVLLASCTSYQPLSFQAPFYHRGGNKQLSLSPPSQLDTLSSIVRAYGAQTEQHSLLLSASLEKQIERGTVLDTRAHEKLLEVKHILARKKEVVVLDVKRKTSTIERLVVKKIAKKAFFTRYDSFYDWNTKLKVGVILLGLGLILSIIGLSEFAALAVLVGLIFLIIGLLSPV